MFFRGETIGEAEQEVAAVGRVVNALNPRFVEVVGDAAVVVEEVVSRESDRQVLALEESPREVEFQLMLGAAIVLRAPVVDVTQLLTQVEMEPEGKLVFKAYPCIGLECALVVVDGVGTVVETVGEVERRFHRKFIAVVLRPKTKGYRVHEQLFGACIGERTRHIEVLPANGAL